MIRKQKLCALADRLICQLYAICRRGVYVWVKSTVSNKRNATLACITGVFELCVYLVLGRLRQPQHTTDVLF